MACNNTEAKNMINKGIPVLHVKGTHYEVGFNIGKCFASQIKSFCDVSPALKVVVLSVYETKNGRDMYEEYLEVTRQHFSEYVDEIRGMADGSGVLFEHLFLLHIRNELITCEGELLHGSGGCSDILVNKPGLKLMAHNEDYVPHTKDYGYIVKARITNSENSGDDECFMSFCYPGILPGSAFNFTGSGFVITCDAVYPKIAMRRQAPRYILNRALLSIKSVDDAVELLSSEVYGCAYAFCCNIGSISNTDVMWSLEVALDAVKPRVHVEIITEATGHCYHFNKYKHFDLEEMEEEISSKSSVLREKRANEFQNPTSVEATKLILGDSKYPDGPIFRTPCDRDDAETLLTAIFDLLDKKMDIYFENPKDCTEPLFSLALKFP